MAILETSGETLSAGGATIYIAASDALATSIASADPTYRCDGTADNVQIQAALDALPGTGGQGGGGGGLTGGGEVVCSEGIYTYTTPITAGNNQSLKMMPGSILRYTGADAAVVMLGASRLVAWDIEATGPHCIRAYELEAATIDVQNRLSHFTDSAFFYDIANQTSEYRGSNRIHLGMIFSDSATYAIRLDSRASYHFEGNVFSGVVLLYNAGATAAVQVGSDSNQSINFNKFYVEVDGGGAAVCPIGWKFYNNLNDVFGGTAQARSVVDVDFQSSAHGNLFIPLGAQALSLGTTGLVVSYGALDNEVMDAPNQSSTLKPLARAAYTENFDDFNGAIDLTRWTLNSGTDPQAIDPAINSAQGGEILLTSGDSDGDVAGDGSQIVGTNPVKPNQGALVFEGVVKLDSIADIQICIGLTDKTTLEMPAEASGAADGITTNFSHGCVFCFDTDFATNEWFAIGVKGNTDATGNGALGVAPTAFAYQRYRIEIDIDGGGARFYFNGTLVGTLTANAATAATSLYPTVVVSSRTTTTKYAHADLLGTSAARANY